MASNLDLLISNANYGLSRLSSNQIASLQVLLEWPSPPQRLHLFCRCWRPEGVSVSQVLPGLQTSRARSVLGSACSVQTETENRFYVLGRAEPRPRNDLITENEPSRAASQPSRDRALSSDSRLVSARLANLGNLYVSHKVRLWQWSGTRMGATTVQYYKYSVVSHKVCAEYGSWIKLGATTNQHCYEAIFNLNLVELRTDVHAHSTIGLATPVVLPLPNRGFLLPSQTSPPSPPLLSYLLQINAWWVPCDVWGDLNKAWCL